MQTQITPGTSIQPQILPQPQAAIAPLSRAVPQTNAASQSCEQLARRRKEGQCREGFFRETPDGTIRFTTWRTDKCGRRTPNLEIVK